MTLLKKIAAIEERAGRADEEIIRVRGSQTVTRESDAGRCNGPAPTKLGFVIV